RDSLLEPFAVSAAFAIVRLLKKLKILRSCFSLVPAAAAGKTLLNRRPFLVVVPGCNHQEGQRMRIVIVAAVHLKRVLESLTATRINVTVEAPRSLAVVEPGPGRPYRNFVRILGFHLQIEVFQILLSPIAPIRSPTLVGMNPCILTIEILRILGRRIVLIDEPGRCVPRVYRLPNLVPIRVPALGKNENHGPPLIQQISIAGRSRGTDIALVRLIEGLQRIFCGVAVIFFRFVVHQSYLELRLTRDLLHDGVTAIEEGMPVAVPIDDESVNAHILCLLDLLPDRCGILAVISDVDMCRVSKPRLIIRDDLRRTIGLRNVFLHHLPDVGAVTSAWDEAGQHNQSKEWNAKTLHGKVTIQSTMKL